MQDALQESHLIINIAEYKSMVEAALPWHDKIIAMANDYAFFSLSVKDKFPAAYVIKFQHIGL